jgi:hypothetical protein
MFDKIKKERKRKQFVVDKINEEMDKYDEEDSSIEQLIELQEKKRSVKLNGVSAGDVFKAVANVAVVVVIVGFEMSHIMNQKASRFIKNL